MTSIVGLLIPILLTQTSAPLEPPLNFDRINQTFRAGDFAALEAIAEQNRTSKARNTEGDWQLWCFYSHLTYAASEFATRSESNFRKHMGAWAEQFPKSVTWRIVLAHGIAELGWNARGEDWARNVTPAGWKYLDKYLSEAWTILQDARKISTSDPQLYFGFLNVALGLTHDPTAGKVLDFGPLVKSNALLEAQGVQSKPQSLQEQIFEEAIAQEKYYEPLYENVNHLFRRWGGSPQELRSFAERAVALTEDRFGQGLYARVAWSVMFNLGDAQYAAYKADTDFDWSRIKAGFEQLEQMYPDADWIRNQYCVMACFYRDRDTAKAQLSKIRKPLIDDVWIWEDGFEFWKQWINGQAPDPDYSPLLPALREHDSVAVKALLDAGANPSAYVIPGMPILQFAINENDLPSVKALLAAHPKLDEWNIGGNSLLTNGLYQRNPAIFEALLDAGADPNRPNSAGWCPLHQMVRDAQFEAAQLLIKHGADVSKPMLPDNWTPLHVAVEFRRPRMLRLLLQHGADQNVKISTGFTPLALAKSRNFPDMVTILEGASTGVTQPPSPSAAPRPAGP